MGVVVGDDPVVLVDARPAIIAPVHEDDNYRVDRDQRRAQRGLGIGGGPDEQVLHRHLRSEGEALSSHEPAADEPGPLERLRPPATPEGIARRMKVRSRMMMAHGTAVLVGLALSRTAKQRP